MKIAVTGGTGFVGRSIARALVGQGHEIILLARGKDRSDPTIRTSPGVRFHPVSLDDIGILARAIEGCSALAHCAGINRELDGHTFERVHVAGTRNVVAAARQAGANKIVLISFLRARPACGSAYHESKWAAEEIVRHSGLDFTVLKCGVIYGRGDHMLDHLSRAFHTFPMFALVGFEDKSIRPSAVEDITRIVKAALIDGALARKTVAVLGPEELTLRQAVRRVARVTGRRPLMFPLPVAVHDVLARLAEKIMIVPLASRAQIRMLAEGLVAPQPPCDAPPPELAPQIPFSEDQIRKGLPPAGPFGRDDLRCCRKRKVEQARTRRVFFEMP